MISYYIIFYVQDFMSERLFVIVHGVCRVFDMTFYDVKVIPGMI